MIITLQGALNVGATLSHWSAFSPHITFAQLWRIVISSLYWQKLQGKWSAFISIKRKTGCAPIYKQVGQNQGLSKWTELVVEHLRSQANNFQGYLCHEDILVSLKPACVPIASIIKHNYWQACSVAGFEGKPNSREDMKLGFNCLHSGLLWDWSLNTQKNLQYFLLTPLIFNNILRFVLQSC